MKIRKMLALALAAMMLFSLVPAFAAPAKAETAEKDVGVMSLETYMNAYGCCLSYTNGEPGFTGVNAGSNSYIESTNQGQANTTASIISCTFHMDAGDELKFQYWYQTEENYDFYIFAVNGYVEFTGSGEVEMGIWNEYSYTAPSDGDYYFTWAYQKDGSTNYGSDCVRVRFVWVTEHEVWHRAKAGLAEGMGGSCISFLTETGDYPFTAVGYGVDEDHPWYLRSNNENQNSSNSEITALFWVEGASAGHPATLYFDYRVSSEANYDKLIFKDNGTTKFGASGTTDTDWHTYEYEVTTNGLHLFTWSYDKDSSQSAGMDCAFIDNIYLSVPVSSDRAQALYSGLNASNSNANLVFNTPDGYQAFVPSNNILGTGFCAASNNRYFDETDQYDSVSVLETVVNMAAGEKLTFQYWVSSEPFYDWFTFSANGEEQMRVSGWDNPDWLTFIFTAPTTGTYTFVWKYSKDYSNSHGWDVAMIKNVRYIGSYHNNRDINDAVINEALNDRDVFFFPAVNEYSYTNFMPVKEDGAWAAASLNKYYDYTEAYLDAMVGDLDVGDVIHFEYKIPAEEDEPLYFAVMEGSDKDGRDPDIYYTWADDGYEDDDWHEFTWESTASGFCQLSFIFEKDYSYSASTDRAFIRNFYITSGGGSPNLPTLDEALNADGTQLQLHFSGTGQFPFEVGADSVSQFYAGSTNQGVNNSTSSMTCTANFQAGDTLSFYYFLDSEENYDWFDFRIDDQRVIHASGENGILLYNYTFTSGGSHTLRWDYVKDSSRDEGLDMVKIYQVKVLHGSGGVSGDANGDGTVDVTDALLVLRYAMGLIDGLPGMDACDVNGDGVVNMTDALIILRMALGIV